MNDIQEALDFEYRIRIGDSLKKTTSDPIPYWHGHMTTLADAYREAFNDRDLRQQSEGECNLAYAELSAKYDRLKEVAKRMYDELGVYYPNCEGPDMMEELL